MINWLNENQGAVMAALTAAYVVTTIVILRATRSAVNEQRHLREEQFRPVVLADVEFDGERMILFFTIENVGALPAKNVRLSISPPFENPKKPELNLDIPPVKDGIAVLVPGRRIRTLIAVAGDLDLKGVRHDVTVSYASSDGRSFTEDFVLDFAALIDIRPSTPKGLHSIAQELEKVRAGIEEIGKALNRARK